MFYSARIFVFRCCDLRNVGHRWYDRSGGVVRLSHCKEGRRRWALLRFSQTLSVASTGNGKRGRMWWRVTLDDFGAVTVATVLYGA